MRHNIFLHFLNRDANLIAGLSKSLKKKDHMRLLSRALTASSFLCEEFCIAPPGFLLETDVALAISKQKKDLISNGVIKLARKENSMDEYVEKKRREYNSVKCSFKGLFNDKYVLELTSALPYFILRKISVGVSATQNWEQGPDKNKIWDNLKNSLSHETLNILLTSPKKLIESNKALTWEALTPYLNEELYHHESQVRYLLQHNYFSLYTEEYNLIVLKEIPLFNDEFNLPTQPKSYSYHWFVTALQQIKAEKILDATGELAWQLLQDNRFIRLIDGYIKASELAGTFTDLRFLFDMTQKRAKFKWEKLADKWLVVNSYDEVSLSTKSLEFFLEGVGQFGELLDEELKKVQNDSLDEIIERSKMSIRDKAAVHESDPEVVILATANARENSAVISALKVETECLNKQITTELNKVLPYAKGYMSGKDGYREVYVVRADETGGIDAANLLRRIFSEFKPAYIFFVGCAALLDEKHKPEQNLVFVANRAIDSDKRELNEKGTEYDMDTEKGDITIIRNLNVLNDAGLFTPLNVVTNRHFISGSAFSKDRTSSYRQDLISKFPKDAVVLEMEAYAILKEINKYQAEGKFFNYAVIKGISDLGDNNAQENKIETQRIATTNAMAVVTTLLKNIQ